MAQKDNSDCLVSHDCFRARKLQVPHSLIKTGMSSGTAGNPACLRQTQCYDSWSLLNWPPLIWSACDSCHLDLSSTAERFRLEVCAVWYHGEYESLYCSIFVPYETKDWTASGFPSQPQLQHPYRSQTSLQCLGWRDAGVDCEVTIVSSQHTHSAFSKVAQSLSVKDKVIRVCGKFVVRLYLCVLLCIRVWVFLGVCGCQDTWSWHKQIYTCHLNTLCLNFSHGSSDTSRFDASYTFTVSPWLAKMTLVICLMIAWSWILNQLSKKVKTFFTKEACGQ